MFGIVFLKLRAFSLQFKILKAFIVKCIPYFSAKSLGNCFGCLKNEEEMGDMQKVGKSQIYSGQKCPYK